MKRKRKRGSRGIYFLRAGDTNRVKIGRSTGLHLRRGTLQTGNHETLTCLGIYCPPGTTNEDLPRLEREMHTRFAAHRATGGGTEFFYLVPEIEVFIAEFCKRGRAAPAPEVRVLGNNRLPSNPGQMPTTRSAGTPVTKTIDIGDSLKLFR